MFRCLMVRGGAVLATVSLLLAASHARANINQWKISGGNIVQSTTACTGGVGVNAMPGANLANLDLTQAYLSGDNLAGANLFNATLVTAFASNGTLTNANLNSADLTSGTLTNAILTGADLSYANLYSSTLTGANLTGAIVLGANFSQSNLSKSQLYSTASYQAGNLSGITLGGNLNAWNFAGQNLTNAELGSANLTSGTFAGANLTGADLSASTLTNASFAGAIVTGSANFSYTNLTAPQLYSTASYQAGNLQGISLAVDDLTGWNFMGKDLTNASLTDGTLSGANLTGAAVVGADFGTTDLTSSQLYSTASYQAHNLQGIGLTNNDLTGWDLSNQDLTGAALTNAELANGKLTGANLTGASLAGADLTNVDVTGATVAGADFSSTGLTSSQLYTTASYQALNLQGISLAGNDLSGANFAGQNLTNAVFSNATLTGANFSNANLTGGSLDGTTLANANLRYANLQNADFTSATTTGADFSAADMRGATGFSTGDSTTTNTILPDGTIQGLHLSGSNSLLTIRDYAGIEPIPIHVTGGMTISGAGTLQIVLSGPTWGSTMSFDAGIPVTLGGVLDMQAPGVDPASLLGKSIQLFDWTGVTPSGIFSQVTSDLPSRYTWDTSGLYTSGSIDLTFSTTAAPITGQWAINGGGDWSSPASWSGGHIPGAPQDTAVFGAVLTAGTAKVNLDFPASLAGLSFSPSSGASYLISSASSSGLTLSNTAGPATLASSTGTNMIAVPMTLQSNLSVSASTGSVLTVSAAIDETGGSRSLTFGGGGKLILSGVNGYSGGTIVSDGTVVVTSPDGLADHSDLTVGNFAVSMSTTIPGQWANNGGGNWSSPADWSSGNIPRTGQDTAAFGAVLISGTANIVLDIPVSLAGLSFSPSSGASYLITSASSNSLTLSNTAGAASVGGSGTNQIAAPITLGSNLSIVAPTGSLLTISAAISESGGHRSLTFSGGGNLILSGTNSYSGGTVVSGGRVVVTSVYGLADGSNLTVGNLAAFSPAVPAETIAVMPVPEPDSVVLLSAAAIAYLGYRSRRR